MNHEQLHDLLNRWFDGQLTPDEQSRLEEVLVQQRDARDEMRRLVNLDAGLRNWAGSGPVAADWIKLAAPARPTRSAPALPRSTKWAIAAGLLLACGTIVAVTGYWWTGSVATPPVVADHTASAPVPAVPASAAPAPMAVEPPAETTVAGGCAVLAQAARARFSQEASALVPGTTLLPGTLEMESGLARIEFFSGASVILRGRTRLELISAREARLYYGTARVRVAPAARGFQLHTPQGRIVDLGTEFGIQVGEDNARSQVEVFSGEVELHTEGQPVEHIGMGHAVVASAAGLQPVLGMGSSGFPTAELLLAEVDRQRTRRFEAWNQRMRELAADERLIALYTCQDRGASTLVEASGRGASSGDGGIVGAAWTTGRWPAKGALEFKQPSDRVRVALPGEFQSLSFTAWVRIDGLDRRYNALFLTDGYEQGEPHWQIDEDGRLMFSLQAGQPGAKANQIYYSRPFFTIDRVGQWFHLAVSYDGTTGEVCQYVNGQQLLREIHPRHQPVEPLVLGEAEIGNWGLPTPNHAFPVRNLNGRIDEFAIWSVVLSEEEIGKHYEAGKPY